MNSQQLTPVECSQLRIKSEVSEKRVQDLEKDLKVQ